MKAYKLLFLSMIGGSCLFGSTAQELLDQNGCFACHAVASQKTAPAFAGIGMRNKRFEGSNAKANIINSIANGSHGKYPHFSNTAMPAFPNFTQDELNTLADYILSQASKAKGRGGMMNHQGRGMGRGRMMME